MRVRRIDESGDWTFGHGRADYADLSESVAQRVVTRLRSFRGDWFLDLGHGIPWIERMERAGERERLETDIKRQILGTAGVAAILSFDVATDGTTRHMTVSTTLRDIYGNESDVSTRVGV
ncbi:conserved hypothetical protein [Paraburkholderia atlantica]|uniref:DUF2634 domain-containing protein n=1 Tax=Paraburkholderia atlantica TaxID=2654982 RepID=D5WMF6_PARAM|nr:hypothetical protein [Paraburkholderia atlantica]ADG20402.1 conserved hypothetical protein [Paraburkholderia atlantica]